MEARRFGKVHVIPRTALRAAEQRKTKPGPPSRIVQDQPNGTAKASTATTAKLNQAFRKAKEAEEAGKKAAKRGKK